MSTFFREPAAETREDDDDEVGSLSPFNVQTIRNHCPIIGQMHTTLAMLNDNIHTLLLPALAVGVTRLETRQQRQIRTTRHHIRRDHTQDVTQQIGPFQTSTVFTTNVSFRPRFTSKKVSTGPQKIRQPSGENSPLAAACSGRLLPRNRFTPDLVTDWNEPSG